MSNLFVYMAIVFCHIVDDFYLQGWLASAKQKSWWEKNAPDELYKNDFSCALLIHGFSWSFMVHLPVIVYNGFNVGVWVFFSWVIHALIHLTVDHLKANVKIINLWQDQITHFTQLFVIFALWVVCV